MDDEIETYRPNSKEKYSTNYEYDPAGRQKKVTQPAAYQGEPETSVTYTYNDPWAVTSEHSVGRRKTTITNARSHVLYVRDSGKGDDGVEVNAAIGFAYDIAGNRVKKMDLTSPPAPLPGRASESG